MFLNFWDGSGPEKVTHRNAFLSNIATMGALLMVAVQAL
jgi:hypothetical protein